MARAIRLGPVTLAKWTSWTWAEVNDDWNRGEANQHWPWFVSQDDLVSNGMAQWWFTVVCRKKLYCHRFEPNGVRGWRNWLEHYNRLPYLRRA